MQRIDSGILGNQATFVTVSVVAALVWPLYFIHLFPLSEARDWLIWGNDNAIVQQVFDNLLWRNTRFSRDFSILAMFGIGRVCGPSVLCVNALVALPLVLAAVALFQLAYVLTERLIASAFITAAWSLSLPFLATAAWQATIHDRIGLLVALCAVTAAWRLPSDAAPLRLLAYSALIAALNFGALNSKEAYWFVPFAVVLCHWLRRLHPYTRRSLRVEAFVLLPLAAYTVWYFVRFVLAGELSGEWSRHVGSGEVIKNASAYAQRAFGSVGLFAILCALIAYALRDWRRFDWATRSKILWCSAVFFLAYVPIARTRFAAEYYFLAPLSFLLLLGAITLIHYQPVRPSRWGQWCKVLALTVVVIGVMKSQTTDVADVYRERARLSNNFRQTLRDTTTLAENAIAKGSICIVTDPRVGEAHLFTDSKFAWNILRWDARQSLSPQLKSIPVTRELDAQCAPLLLDKNLRPANAMDGPPR